MLAEPCEQKSHSSDSGALELPSPATKADFHRLGLSIADWALARGYSPHLVYSVLSGKRKCLRGQSHQIAKELGMR